MNFDVACYSEQGGRPVNEDAVFAAGTPGTLLTLVADGLGGMGHGDLASSDAAEHLSRLSAHPVDEDMLCGAIQEENRRIWDMHTDGNQMMTTVAVLCTSSGTGRSHFRPSTTVSPSCPFFPERSRRRSSGATLGGTICFGRWARRKKFRWN